MVSLRRRRLLGLSSGGSSSLSTLPDNGDANPNGSSLSALPDSGDANPNGSSLRALPDSANPNGNLISTGLKTTSGDVEMKESTVSSGSTQSSNGSDSSSSSVKLSDENSTVVGAKRKRMPVQKYSENHELVLMKGVYFRCTKWQAAIKVGKKQIHLGTFASQEEAAHVYDRAAFLLGRKPNFELPEEEKQELRKLNWEEFLAMTRTMVTKRMYKSPVECGLLLSSKSSLHNNDLESEQEGESNDVDSPAAAAIAGGSNVVASAAEGEEAVFLAAAAKEGAAEAEGSNVVSSADSKEEEVVSPAAAAKEEVAKDEAVSPAAAAKDEAVSPAAAKDEAVSSTIAAKEDAFSLAEGTNAVSPGAKEADSPAAEEE